MTMPDNKAKNIPEKRRRGVESVEIFEAAQQAIEETRKLLDDVARKHVLPRSRTK